MYLVNVSDDPQVISRRLADLEALYCLAKECRRALIQMAEANDPVMAFNEAKNSVVVPYELEVYVEAIMELAACIDRAFGRSGKVTARKAEQTYLEVRATIRELTDRLRRLHARKPASPPPQVGSRVSICTVSGGLPTLGRKRP